MHRLIAREIARRPETVEEVVRSFPERRPGEPFCAEEWRGILHRGPDYVRSRICERSEEMNRLRISSPLAGVVNLKDVKLRRRIMRKAKLLRNA